MYKTNILFPFFSIFYFSIAFGGSLTEIKAQNSLIGKVTMPKERVLKIGGSNYNADGLVSDPKKRIEIENHPDRNVVISLHPIDFTPMVKPMARAILTQKEKTFIPHVLPITKGSVVYISNEDEFYHNVHSKKPFGLFNIGRKEAGIDVPVTIRQVGLIRVACNEHTEMKGFILSLDTPYFTKANKEGLYNFPDLPDGRYQMQVFHPDMKRPREYGIVEIKNGTRAEKNINLARP